MDLHKLTIIVANIGLLYVTLCFGDKPHIIFMIADDLGWNDVGWHNDKVKTPVLDGLVAEGVEIDRLYTAPICTPSRASLLTGMYPFNTGLQHSVLHPGSPHCAPSDQAMIQELLPEEYRKVFIGKWHVGYCNKTCTPKGRGYDSFYGFYNGAINHYSHEFWGGFDWYDNSRVEWETRGMYSTDLLRDAALQEINNFNPTTENRMFMVVSWAAVHWPVQAPKLCRDVYPSSVPEPRRTYLGMMTCMDSAIGVIIAALQKKNMWENTVFVFESDNGGEAGGASNYPLAGGKATVWEGGVRVPAFAYSKLFLKSGYKHEGYMHQADWLPTLLSMTETSIPANIDGIDQSKMIMNGASSTRNTLPITFDTLFPQYCGVGALIHDRFKLIIGFPGIYSGHGDENGIGMYQTMHNLDKITNGFDIIFSQPDGPDRIHDCYTEEGKIKQRCTEHYLVKFPDKDADYESIFVQFNLIKKAVLAMGEYKFVQLFNLKEDPREMVNLAKDPAYSAILKELINMAKDYISRSRIATDPHMEVPVSQSQENGAWTPGFCDMPPSEYYKRKLNTIGGIWVYKELPWAYLWTIMLAIIVTYLIFHIKGRLGF